MNICTPGNCICGAEETPGDEPCERARIAEDHGELFARAFFGDIDAARALHLAVGRTPELVYLNDPADGRSKWFPVHDEAYWGYSDDEHYERVVRDDVAPVVMIGRGTQDLEWIRGYLRRMVATNGVANPTSLATWGMVIWARNKTQIRDYLLEQGLTRVMFGGKLYPIEEENDMTRIAPDSSESLIESARAALARAEEAAQAAVVQAATLAQSRVDAARARLERIESMPREPQPDDNGFPPIVYFNRTFTAGGRGYDYAAIRTPDGRWNTTGPKAPKSYSWAELVAWIMEAPEPVEIFRARKFRDL